METKVRETSVQAYHKIKDEGLLSEARMVVYDILFHGGPLTAGEIFKLGQERLEGHTEVKGSICARLTELRESGAVKEIGKKTCHVTGHNAILWDVTGQIPEKIERKKSKTQIIAELEFMVDALKGKVEELEREIRRDHGRD
jgi:hypothetical protein